MTALLGQVGPFEDQLVVLFDRPGVAVAALLSAVAVGAGHALAPGHGKSLAAAYLVGDRGRARDAVGLGLVVAAMHTASVLVIAIGWHLLLDVAAPDLGRLTAWLQLLAALLVLTAGVLLVRRRLAHRGDPRHHHHVPAPSVQPWSRRGLALLGVSGGLVPSPSAFLVVLSGLLTGRFGFALALVGAFAVGMAATLGGVGVAAVRGRDLLSAAGSDRPSLRRLASGLPMVAAVGVLAGGCVLSALAGLRLLTA